MAYNFEGGSDGLKDDIREAWGVPQAVADMLDSFVNQTIGSDGVATTQTFPGGPSPTTIGSDVEVAEITGGGTFTTQGQNILIRVTGTEPVVINGITVPGGGVAIIGGPGGDEIRILSGAASSGDAAADLAGTGLVIAGDGDDTVIGGDGHDMIDGGDGDDSLMGGEGDDTIDGGTGSDMLDGGAGFDEGRMMHGSRADYSVTMEGGDLILTANAGDETDRLSDIEYVRFGDGEVILALDSKGDGDVARLYEIVLDRAADYEGLKFWLDIAGAGFDIEQLADFFVTSDEFQARLANDGNSAFTQLLYEEGFDRDGDEAGLAFWQGLLDQGQLTRAEVAVFFAVSEEAEDTFDYILNGDGFDLI